MTEQQRWVLMHKVRQRTLYRSPLSIASAILVWSAVRVDQKRFRLADILNIIFEGNYHMRILCPRPLVPLPDLFWISSEQLRLASVAPLPSGVKSIGLIYRSTSLRPSLVRTAWETPGGVWTISPSGIPLWHRTSRRRRLGWTVSNNASAGRLPRISGRGNPVRSSQREHPYEYQTRHAVPR
jgi:hypothetical protein